MQDQWQFEDKEADVDDGGASAGAQDGGIVDTGSADNQTDYEDQLAGRKGGAVTRSLDDVDNDLMDSGDNIGSMGAMATDPDDGSLGEGWTGSQSQRSPSGI